MTRRELKEIIKLDRKNYSSGNILKDIYFKISNNLEYRFLKNIILARKYRYYKENNNKLLMLYYARKNNILSQKNNIELFGEFGKNLKIYHSNVIINKNSILGDNVKFHGMNCVGNKNDDNKAPKIGNNVDIGVGAMIIGDITIADGIKIGTNAVVTKSFYEKNITIAGVPAKKIKIELE